MTRPLALILILSPGMALAHLGHLADAAGHDHWLAGAALGAAAVAGLYGWWKGRKEESEAAPEANDEEGAEA